MICAVAAASVRARVMASLDRTGRLSLGPDRARAVAERLHLGQQDAAGELVIQHLGRVAARVPANARVVAWLHEVLESTAVPEETLLAEGLSTGELRALRLLVRSGHARDDLSYLAHARQIARAVGSGAALARAVKRADVADRITNPEIRADGWSPPYLLSLMILVGASARAGHH
jgi:HAMP domain-containing protein